MIENKNRFIAIIVLIAVPIVVVFYILWGIVLNKGDVVFEGSPPFNIVISNHNVTCAEPSCTLSVSKGLHTYTLSKEGYHAQTGSVIVKRGSREVVTVNLEYITQVLEGEDYNVFALPVGYSKFEDRLYDVTLFHNFIPSHSLKRLPKKIDDIRFSPSGKKGIVFESGTVSLYDTSEYTTNELSDISDAKAVSWSDDESKIYTLSFEENSKREALKRVYLDGSLETESLIFFIRDIDDYSLSVSPDERYVAVVDKTFRPEVLYIVDLQEETRTNVFEGHNIETIKWSPDGLLYAFKATQADGNIEKLWYFDSSLAEIKELPFQAQLRNFDFDDAGSAYFATTQDYSLSGDTYPYFITFIEVDESFDYTTLFDETAEPKDSILVRWDIRTGDFYLVQDLSEAIPAIPDKVEISEDSKILRVLSAGQTFDIQLAE